MENVYIVYKHTCPNGKCYIGITGKTATERWRNGLGYTEQLFGRAIKKYGWENIKHEVLYTELSRDEANAKEKELIAECHSNDPTHGYNCTLGGDGTSGHKGSSERSRASMLRMWQNEETKAKLLKHLAELNASRIGIKRSPEAVRKGALSRGRRINQYSLDGDYIQSFPTFMDAARSLGKNDCSDLVTCCKGKRNFAQGYRWKYAEDDTKEKLPPLHEHQYNIKPVTQYTLEGQLVRHYKSFAEAERITGISKKHINQCALGKRKTAKGYIWKPE